MLAIIVLVVEVIILIIVKAVGVINIGNGLASLFIVGFSVVFLASIQKSEYTERYSNQIAIGYLIRIVFLFFDLFGTRILTLPQSGADSAGFYYNATLLAIDGHAGRETEFAKFMGMIFKQIGINRLYAQFLLMLLSIAAIIAFITVIDKLDITSDTKTWSAWVICVLPNFALLSSIFLRESLVTFLVTISICLMSKWMNDQSIMYFVISVCLSILACIFHSGCIGITIGYILCLFIYDRHVQKIRVTIGGIVFALAMGFGLSFLFLQYGNLLLGKFTYVENMADIANMNEAGGSSYLKYVGNSNNILNMILFTIPRIVYFLFSPFPWQWRGISDIIAFFFSGLFYLITIKNTINYLRSSKQKNRGIIICLFVIAFICTFIFAWGVSNTGTATRHRDKMVCLYGIIYALTLNISDTNQEKVKNKLGAERYKSYIY